VPRRMSLLTALLVLFWPGPPGAQPTTFARMDLQELAARATYVARVRCTDTTARWDSGLVWTVTALEVIEAWKGRPPATFLVRLPGGERAGWRVAVEGAPRFVVGEEAVLFLEIGKGQQMNIVSWAQGTFRIRRNARTGGEEAMQDTAGVRVLDAASGKFSEGAPRPFTLAGLRAAVTRALEGPRP